MRKLTILAAMMGLFISGAFASTANAQSLQQFDQEDFEELMRTNPELLGEVINADGSVNRLRLEEILRDNYNYTDEDELTSGIDFEGIGSGSLLSDRTPEEIENDVALQKRLAEEREKAYEKYKKRNGIE